MIILIGNWLQVLNAKCENCSRSVTRTGCRRTGTTSLASLWCEINLLKIVLFFNYLQLLPCQQFLRLVETSKRSDDDLRWDPENERSPTLFPPFPQVVTSLRWTPSSTRTAVTTWTPSQSSAQVKTGALLRLKLLHLSWWRPMPTIRENLVFTFLGLLRKVRD